MTDIPEEYKYADSHEWALPTEDQTLTIGITDHAQSQLGDVVFVELPEVGQQIAKGEVFGVIESVKAASDVFAPISGTVIAINDTLVEQPQLINESAYEEGWIIKIKPTDLTEFDEMMDAKQYQAVINDTIEE